VIFVCGSAAAAQTLNTLFSFLVHATDLNNFFTGLLASRQPHILFTFKISGSALHKPTVNHLLKIELE
jgi:hypothetical protein